MIYYRAPIARLIAEPRLHTDETLVPNTLLPIASPPGQILASLPHLKFALDINLHYNLTSRKVV